MWTSDNLDGLFLTRSTILVTTLMIVSSQCQSRYSSAGRISSRSNNPAVRVAENATMPKG
jgi:hypothetical protein